MTKMQSFLQTMKIPSSRIDTNISSNETNKIKENREYLTAILRAMHYLGRQGLALRGKYDDGNPTNEDVVNKGNFKELFNVMCESNDRLLELFIKRKTDATLISKTIQNKLLSCVREYILKYIKRLMKKELLILVW